MHFPSISISTTANTTPSSASPARC